MSTAAVYESVSFSPEKNDEHACKIACTFENNTHFKCNNSCLQTATQQCKEIHKVKSYRQIYFTGIYVTTILQI